MFTYVQLSLICPEEEHSHWNLSSRNSFPLGLSMTANGNLLVVAVNKRGSQLELFNTSGSRIGVTPLSWPRPECAIEVQGGTFEGKFAVSHKEPERGISIVEPLDGTQVAIYQCRRILNQPRGLVWISKSDCLLVADKTASRIVLIDLGDRDNLRGQVVPVDVQLCGPQQLYLDQTQNRLYVGEFAEDGRVIVFENVNQLTYNTQR
jgi:DNA-binding beta-propeller fold protein YncE